MTIFESNRNNINLFHACESSSLLYIWNFIIKNTRKYLGAASVETATMGKIANLPLRFLVSSVLVMVITMFFVPYKSVLVFSSPPASGDWVVTGTESYSDEVIVLNGNLIVEDGGNLTFKKVTLEVNCTYNGQYNITVMPDGEFNVLEGSVIASADQDKRIGFFFVRGHSTFRMNNSELHDCGSEDPELAYSGLRIVDTSNAIIENSLFSRNMLGMIIQSDGNIIVRNNNITANDDKGIHVFCGAPIFCDNHVSSNRIGIGVGGGNPTICNNTITLNNELGVFASGGNPTIYNNTIKLNKHEGLHCGGIDCHPTVQGNVITSNSGQGITFINGISPIIRRNVISLNTAAGILGDTNCSPTVEGNNITSNGGQGCTLLRNCTGIIQGNMIENNSLGIGNAFHSNPLIQGNIITSNLDVGVHCANNSLPEVHWNDIYGNGILGGMGIGIENDDPSVTVNATYNYWGNGPSTSLHVLYDPWLTESIVFPKITSPLSGGTVSSTVTVSTIVYARSGVGRVEFYIDDQLEYIDYDAPFEWDWNTTQYAESEHEINAKAYDAFGLKTSTSITIFVDNTAPAVSIKEPVSGNIYSGTADISVNVTDNRELANVYVKVDNTEWLVMTYNSTDLLWKYDLNTATLSDGQHTLMFLALDKASNPTTTSTTLFVDNTPPTLTIQTPQSGTTVGMTLSVEIQANDASGISRIEFYLQDVLVYIVHDTPYEWLWDTTQYPNGECTVTVKAYDLIGHITSSETTVTVKNVESPWWQTNFWTIIEVLVAIGGLMLAIITFFTRKREEKKKSK